MNLLRRYRRWLGSKLKLTPGGRVSFTVVLVLGLVGVVGDDTTGGVEGPNAAAALGVYVILLLLAVIAADAVFRVGRSRVGRPQ